MKLLNLKMTFLLVVAATFVASAQAPENWFNLDYSEDGTRGVGTERVYKELAKGMNSKEVIVAVIDSGVDVEHEDLQGKMWVNTREIAGNKKDDDGNGYVDDIHGWNFLGGADGRNVNSETLEVTRLYAHYMKKFNGIESDKGLSKKERKQYAEYKKVKKEVEEKKQAAEAQLAQFDMTKKMYMGGLDAAREILGDKELTQEVIDGVEPGDDPAKGIAVRLLTSALAEKMTMDQMEEQLTEQLAGAVKYYEGQSKYMYNPEWNPRADIIKDNYANSYEIGYGNGDVEGPDAGHGTHVAGIIAANRNNDLGMMGVAENVKIMSLRAVPDGDEHDKDIANAIRYAVDNGASIINMSFGKSYGWDKNAVDSAVKYALAHDVLLVHAAGNSNQNNDESSNFPNDKFAKKKLFGKKMAKNWLEVGALSWKKGEEAPARFSNYGAAGVDLFAPGVDIYSTVPQVDAYASYSGTSMASPVTAGVAAMLRSYFPTLSAVQVKQILMDSTTPIGGEVKIPGGSKMVSFKDLSVTGGVVNAYKAFQMAKTTKGKKKMKKKKA